MPGYYFPQLPDCQTVGWQRLCFPLTWLGYHHSAPSLCLGPMVLPSSLLWAWENEDSLVLWTFTSLMAPFIHDHTSVPSLNTRQSPLEWMQVVWRSEKICMCQSTTQPLKPIPWGPITSELQ